MPAARAATCRSSNQALGADASMIWKHSMRTTSYAVIRSSIISRGRKKASNCSWSKREGQQQERGMDLKLALSTTCDQARPRARYARCSFPSSCRCAVSQRARLCVFWCASTRKRRCHSTGTPKK
jgi:hypothetical protein